MSILLKILVKLQRFVLRNLLLVLPPETIYRMRLRILYESDLLLACIERSEQTRVRLVRSPLLRLLPMSWLKTLTASARSIVLGSLWRSSQISLTLADIRQLKRVQSYIDSLSFEDPKATFLLASPISYLLTLSV